MRPDGKIERHDELLRTAWFVNKEPGRRDAPATLRDLYSYIDQALRLHQGYYQPHPINGFSGSFPFAWSLEEGMKVYNTTIGVVYEIKEVQRDDNNNPTGYVVLSGGNGIEPEATHRLEFSREDSLVFMHGFPKTFAKTYSFSDDGSGSFASQYSERWRDTITFLVTRKEPGSLSGSPFDRPRDVKPHHRESEVYAADTDYMISYTGQWFDAIIQLDCWSKTNKTAERLLEWLEGFLEFYRGVFRYNGINNLYYWDRTADELVTRWRDDIVNRTLRYYIRTENVAAVLESKIRVIAATFGLMPTGIYWPTGFPWTSEWTQPTGIDPDVIPVEIYEQPYN